MPHKNFELTNEWKTYARQIPDEIANHLAKVVCLQIGTGCARYDSSHMGDCAMCADTAESVIGEYLRLTEKSK